MATLAKYTPTNNYIQFIRYGSCGIKSELVSVLAQSSCSKLKIASLVPHATC